MKKKNQWKTFIIVFEWNLERRAHKKSFESADKKRYQVSKKKIINWNLLTSERCLKKNIWIETCFIENK